MTWLLENETTGWSYSGAADGDQVRGNRFHVSADITINYVSFLWPVNDTAYLPVAIKVWDEASTATPVINVTSIPTPAAQGWVFQSITPYTLLSGHDYTVAWIMASGTHVSWKAGAVPTTPPSPFSWLSPAHKWGYHTTAFPTQTDDVNYYAVGVSTDVPTATSGTGGQIVSTTDLQDALADWLISTSDNVHQSDGLPWLTKTAADAIKVVTDKLGSGGSGNSLDWIAALWRLAGDLTDAEIGLLKTLLDRQSQITGSSGGGGSAFYGPSGTQVAAGVEQLLASGITPTNLGAALALLREQLTLSPDLSDTSRWTLVDTTSGDGDALVSQQADAYFFSITAYPASQAAHGVAATLWLPRWGWVCPRVHGHFAQRQFHDVLPTIITSEGHLMDGLLIYTPQGFEWTCESYVLDR